jgi:hypothetical protein
MLFDRKPIRPHVIHLLAALNLRVRPGSDARAGPQDREVAFLLLVKLPRAAVAKDGADSYPRRIKYSTTVNT